MDDSAADLEVEVLGTRVGVRLPPGLTATVREQWRWCAPTHPGPIDRVVDLSDRLGLAAGHVEESLARELTLRAIEHQRGQRLMLHAACLVEQGSGRALVVVGDSGAGKTTASIHLCRNGFAYATDETVALDEARTAMLYRKPLSVRDNETFKTQHAPERLGLDVARVAPEVGAIVLLSRDPDHDAPTLEPVPLLDAMSELIAQSSSLVDLPGPLSRLVDLVRATGGVQRLRYREIADATDVLRETVGSRRPVELDAVLSSQRPAQTTPKAADNGQAYQRADHLEACRHQGEVLALIADRPVRLSGIGATIWSLTSTPRTSQQLVDGCVEAHGPAPDAKLRVGEVVEQLCAAGVLTPAG